MERSQLGVAIIDLGMGIRDALRRAASAGFGAVELNSATGDTAARELSQSGRRHLALKVRSAGMTPAALDAEVRGTALTDPRHVAARIDIISASLQMAREIGARVVTSSLGPTASLAELDLAAEALREIGDHADRTGTLFAVQTTDVQPESLSTLLEDLDCPALGVCFDPAGILIEGLDPLDCAGRFADNIMLSHIRDAVPGGPNARGREAELGTGRIEFQALLALLAVAGYRGPHVLRRFDAVWSMPRLTRARSYLESAAMPS
jgi:sugar phosphate isomerase/epimerase